MHNLLVATLLGLVLPIESNIADRTILNLTALLGLVLPVQGNIADRAVFNLAIHDNSSIYMAISDCSVIY